MSSLTLLYHLCYHTLCRHQSWSSSPGVPLVPGGTLAYLQNTKAWQSIPISQGTGSLTPPEHLGKYPLHAWPASKHFASFHSPLSLKKIKNKEEYKKTKGTWFTHKKRTDMRTLEKRTVLTLEKLKGIWVSIPRMSGQKQVDRLPLANLPASVLANRTQALPWSPCHPQSFHTLECYKWKGIETLRLWLQCLEHPP